jgi:S-(hydroxymethyl)glutathione dehydrogenase/alcohol dehydrogenase
MSANTVGKVITCKAPICWGPKKGQTIEEIEVSPPKAGEVRVKIVANGVCRSDAHHLDGDSPDVDLRYPTILGHEGSGIVESVGPGVTSVAAGDHVVMLYLPSCLKGQECERCLNPKTNMCSLDNFNTTYVMRDGTSRFSHKGQTIYHYIGISTFSEYTVARETQVAKVNPKATLDKICLIGCCLAQGFGAAQKMAGVTPGSSCAIFGLGAIGLATALGCRDAGAKRIIAIDTNPDKFEFAKKFGCNEFINPKDLDIPIQKYFQNQGGLDYTFECVGGNQMVTLRAAFESLAPWGTAIFSGVTKANVELSIKPNLFLDGRTIRGSSFGGYKSREGVQKLVEKYLAGDFSLDDFITGRFTVDDVPHCFELLRQGKACRSLIEYKK